MKELFVLLTLIVLVFSGCRQSEKTEETKRAASPEEITSKEETPSDKKEEITSKEETPSERKVVALINGRPVYEENLGKRKRPVEDVIVEEILYQEGLKQGLDKDKMIEKSSENDKRRLIINLVKDQFMRSLKKKKITASDEEIEKFYKDNKNKFTYLHLKRIDAADKNIAEEIHKRALKGEDFEKIASEYSNSGSTVTVKDLGFTNNYNNLFDKKEVGTVSNIQQGKQFRILKVVDVKMVPLANVKRQIEKKVISHKEKQEALEYIEKLKQENNIKVEVLK